MGWAAECAVQLTRARDELAIEFHVLRHAKLAAGEPVKLTLQRSPWLVLARAGDDPGGEAPGPSPSPDGARKGETTAWGGTRIRGAPDGDTIRIHRRSAGKSARLELHGPPARGDTLRAWEARFTAALDACLAIGSDAGP